jgi:hypothetical protein
MSEAEHNFRGDVSRGRRRPRHCTPKMTCPENKVQSDSEILVAALEEAQRLLAAQDTLSRRSRDDVLAMIEYIICDPAVTHAMLRQKTRSRLLVV